MNYLDMASNNTPTGDDRLNSLLLQMQEDREYLQHLYRYLPICIFRLRLFYEEGVVVDFETIDVNNEIEHLTGLPAATFIGKRGRDFPADLSLELGVLAGIVNTDSKHESLYRIPGTDKFCHTILFSPRQDEVVALLLDTTETQLAHKALEEREDLLRNVYANLPVGLEIFDKDGILIEANDKDVEILGVKDKNSYLGVNIFEHPILPLEVKERMKRGETINFNSSYDFSGVGDYYHDRPIRKDVMNLTTKIAPVFDKQNNIRNFIFINIDETDTTGAYKRIQEFEEYFSLIADSAKVGYFKWNLIKQEGFAISQWFKNLGKPANSLMSENFAEIYDNLHPEDYREIETFYRKALTGKARTLHREVRVRNSDGSLNWLRCTFTVKLFDPENENVELIGVSYDITELKEMVLARDKAEALDKLKSTFVANMSHEIRTPLNAIVGFSSLLSEIEDPEERDEYVKIIQLNNDLLLQLISDVLDLSKIEAGTFKFTREEIHVNTLCTDIIRSFSVRQNERVALVFDTRSPDYLIYGDPNRLKQVITNFISNSLKFTEEGEITLGYIADNNELVFYVKDTGAGIAPEHVSRIFDQFVKVDSFSQGTGLGLSICKSLVEQMGGRIGVESKENFGSRFWFSHPFQLSLQPGYQQIESDDKPETPKESLPLILIAEENNDNYAQIHAILKNTYNTIRAKSGKEAIALYTRKSPHLILMDARLPDTSGIEAARIIRESDKKTPIIAIVSFAFEEDRIHAIDAGCNDYVTKPVLSVLLREKIKNLIKNQ